MLAAGRGAYTIIEQPLNSMLLTTQHIVGTLSGIGSSRYVSSLGAFGAASEKQVELFTTYPKDIVHELLVRSKVQYRAMVSASATDRGHLTRIGKRSQDQARSTRVTGWNKGHWTNGGSSALAESKVYPKEFCEAIAAIVKSQL